MLLAVTLPADLGRIQENHKGSQPKTIILIEEAHVAYEGQKALAAILQDLIEHESLHLILTEGGWGPVSLSHLRYYGTAEGRKEVAERYLQEGKISGEEYLQITSNLPMTLWGIEDEKLYAQNMEAFLELNGQEEKLKNEIKKLNDFLKTVQEKNFPKEIQELFSKRQSYQAQTLSLIDYLQFLQKAAGEESFQNYPVLSKLSAFIKMQTNMDSEQVEFEKNKLIQILSRRLAKPEFLETSGLQNEKSLEGQLAFYKKIISFEADDLKKSVKFNLLKTHAGVLEQFEKLDGPGLFKELSAFERTVLEAKAGAGNKDLLRFILNAETLQKLFLLQINPEDFAQIETDPAFSDLSTWKDTVPQFASSGPQLDFFSKYLPAAKHFYVSARARERAMVENTIKKVNETKDPVVAIIAGGFHSEGFAKAFKERGYGFVRISPRFDVKDSEAQHKKYLGILKLKWEAPSLKKEVSQQNPGLAVPVQRVQN